MNDEIKKFKIKIRNFSDEEKLVETIGAKSEKKRLVDAVRRMSKEILEISEEDLTIKTGATVRVKVNDVYKVGILDEVDTELFESFPFCVLFKEPMWSYVVDGRPVTSSYSWFREDQIEIMD